MIRINLLAEKKKRGKARGPVNFTVILLVVSVATLLIMAMGIFFLKSKVSGLRTQSDMNKSAIGDLSMKVNEIKKYEQLNKALELKSGIIEILRKNQSVPVRILDEVSSLVPEGIWLEALSYKDNGVSLEGHAFTNIDIVSYVENLKKSKSFIEVYLEESRETEIEKVKVYRFKMNFKVRV